MNMSGRDYVDEALKAEFDEALVDLACLWRARGGRFVRAAELQGMDWVEIFCNAVQRRLPYLRDSGRYPDVLAAAVPACMRNASEGDPK
jgi:hypothetical protein